VSRRLVCAVPFGAAIRAARTDHYRCLQFRYDPLVGMSCLREVRVSKANASQRAGRAGRVREGYAYHLFLTHELEEMADQQLPEMLRCPLESVALRIKTLGLGRIGEFLAGAIEPPSKASIDHVVAVLSGLTALEVSSTMGAPDEGGAKKGRMVHREELTPLGVLLAGLPVDPRVGKMLIFGAIFRCVGPTLLIAASLSFRSPFFSPFDKREEANAAKKGFDPTSDHITVLQAFMGWKQSKQAGRGAERDYLHDNFLSKNTLMMIEKMANQFQRQLQEIGFYHRKADSNYNENAENFGLIKAILVAGLYPNVVKIEAASGGGGGKGGKGAKAPRLKTRKIWEAGSKEETVSLHPGSVLGGTTNFGGSFLVFHEKVKTSQVYVRDASVVSTFALLLFGGSVEVEHLKGQAVLDGWLRFSVAAQHAAFIVAMRAKLQEIMRVRPPPPPLFVG
jgi:ATP-dependent RNA helicase DHX36